VNPRCVRLRRAVKSAVEDRPPLMADGGTETVDSVGEESGNIEPPESDESGPEQVEMDEIESGVETDESDESEPEQVGMDEAEPDVETDENSVSEEIAVSEDSTLEEVPSDAGLEPADAIQNLDTYTAEEEGYRFQIQSVSESGGNVRYAVVVYREGHQGPVYRGPNLPDDTADALGITRSLQDKLNLVVGEANRQVEMPEALKTSERVEIGELEENLRLSK